MSDLLSSNYTVKNDECHTDPGDSVHSSSKVVLKTNVFSTILHNNLLLEKYAVHLSPSEIKYMYLLLNGNPKMFTQIHQTVDDILKDGVIDIHDIPNIVLLISKIYQSHMILEMVQHINLLSIIRFTIDSLLDSGLIPLPQMEITIIKKVVDVSIDLLSTNLNMVVKESKMCWKWFKELFHGCSPSPSTTVPTITVVQTPGSVSSTKKCECKNCGCTPTKSCGCTPTKSCDSGDCTRWLDWSRGRKAPSTTVAESSCCCTNNTCVNPSKTSIRKKSV